MSTLARKLKGEARPHSNIAEKGRNHENNSPVLGRFHNITNGTSHHPTIPHLQNCALSGRLRHIAGPTTTDGSATQDQRRDRDLNFDETQAWTSHNKF